MHTDQTVYKHLPSTLSMIIREIWRWHVSSKFNLVFNLTLNTQRKQLFSWFEDNIYPLFIEVINVSAKMTP